MTPADVLEGRARWCVCCADCLDVLPTLPPKSVGHVITDPPYSEGLYARTRTNSGSDLRPNGKPVARFERATGATASALALASMSIGSVDGILEPSALEFLRLATRWIIAFSDAESVHWWVSAFGDCHVRVGAWVKSNPMPQISGDRPAAGFEPCAIAHARPRGRMHWNGGGRAAVWTHPNAQGPERPEHPCPKPLGLMLDLVAEFTDPGEVVLDPYCGSGTTGVACLRLGRRFIGIERDATYAAVAEARLRAEEQGLSLRDVKAGQFPLFAGAT